MLLRENADAYHSVLRAENMAEDTRLMLLLHFQCVSVFNAN